MISLWVQLTHENINTRKFMMKLSQMNISQSTVYMTSSSPIIIATMKSIKLKAYGCPPYLSTVNILDNINSY